MLKLALLCIVLFIALPSYGFEIFALGTSNTNCKGAGQAYTSTLNDLLGQEKINAQVINSGVDGDKPTFMMTRLEQGLKANPNIKIVIFEPGPNERNKSFNLSPSEEILTYLQKINMPTIYVSHQAIQSSEDASEMAKKYGAYYYGHWIKNVPIDTAHRQYDQPGQAGHMTVAGCQLWAKNMMPMINQVIKEKNIQ
jgi:hypothetical protein